MVSAAYFARSLKQKSHKYIVAKVVTPPTPLQFPSGYINFILPSPAVTPFDLLTLILSCHLMMFMKENVTCIA